MKKIIGACTAILLLGATAFVDAGWNSRALGNLDVSVDYVGYSSRNSLGEPVYNRGDFVKYIVTIRNNGKRPLKKFAVQSTLFWLNTETCAAGTFSYTQSLPGGSQSAVRYLNIGSGGVGSFSAAYVIPTNVCPNKVVVHLDQVRGGNGASLNLPLKFEIR